MHSQTLISNPAKTAKMIARQLAFENLFKEVIILLEEITKFGEFKAEVIEMLTDEGECLKHLSSLQYTIQNRSLALRFTKFIKKNFSHAVLDGVGEAIFEFEFDLCSMTSVEHMPENNDAFFLY